MLCCRVVVGVGGFLLLLLVCLAACCGCMIPSEECFHRLGRCMVLTRAQCWCNCCGWRRQRSDWVDPDLPGPPQHHYPHHDDKLGNLSHSRASEPSPTQKLDPSQGESPKGELSGIAYPLALHKTCDHTQYAQMHGMNKPSNSWSCITMRDHFSICEYNWSSSVVALMLLGNPGSFMEPAGAASHQKGH